MTTTAPPRSIGDILEDLRPQDLILSPALAHPGVDGTVRLANAPSNQAILDATRQFYGAHQPVVDTTATNTGSVAQNQPQYVSTMNGYSWNNQQLSSDEQTTTDNAVFGSSTAMAAAGDGGGGLFGPTLDGVKADQLFSTIGVGINADVQFFVGGAGGLGCMWDIAKREGPKGYGFATGEIGVRVTASLNVQCLILNQLPSATNFDIYGLKVSIDLGVSVSFQVFWVGTQLTLLGYGIGAGVGLGGGATIFGGHIWNFG
jgi:hypothetical protein